VVPISDQAKFFSHANISKHPGAPLTAGATVEGNDLTLLYGANTDENQSLLTVTERRKFLPSEIYAKLVQDTVVCCVDIVLVRTNADGTKQCLLVERSSEPVKGVWWFPGGRLLKGETFFDAGKSLCLESARIMLPVLIFTLF
jgi:hypothetical protein